MDFERGIPLSPPPDVAAVASGPDARFAPEPAAAPTRFDEDEAEEPVAGLPPPDPAIVLSEGVDDGALFSDPTLEIAKLDADDVREIVVPVQVGAGTEVKRFKLSIRLRLDPVD